MVVGIGGIGEEVLEVRVKWKQIITILSVKMYEYFVAQASSYHIYPFHLQGSTVATATTS